MKAARIPSEADKNVRIIQRKDGYHGKLTEGGKVEINVGKDGISTTANGENSDALTVVGQVFGDVAVNSEGDIIAAGTNQSVGISTTIYPDSSLTVHVGGGVQATTGSKDSETMAVGQMLMGGQTNISVDQDVTAAKLKFGEDRESIERDKAPEEENNGEEKHEKGVNAGAGSAAEPDIGSEKDPERGKGQAEQDALFEIPPEG